MSDFVRFDKQNLTLAFAWVAAVFAYYAWRESCNARHAARANRDPIEVDCEATDGDESEGTDA
ncbi:hypothetical protein EXE53_25240 [Halorubrum sp. SD626R]|uniref:hypothetical protein n=1 Tax=Halorubrum sp. SD626R TaxID=1419722 RepID=UPI0010F456F3|nr:hypothetical protein [Halorubrum sp. SD626R]TKX77692.1 hypothetical protein EXE53_25240 [Halorubrum sp. SD626R]